MFKGQDHMDLIFIYKTSSCPNTVHIQTNFESSSIKQKKSCLYQMHNKTEELNVKI